MPPGDVQVTQTDLAAAAVLPPKLCDYVHVLPSISRQVAVLPHVHAIR